MDHRTPLKLHTQIAFEGMSYFVEDVIGQGSNAIVYKGWYPDKLNPDQRHHVLIKELFPFHPKRKIWRSEDNCIVVEPDAKAHWNTHKESFLAGNEVHLRLLADHPDMVGGNLNSFCANGTLYSILGYTGGRSLQAELNASRHDLRHYARLTLRLLDALEAFHKSGCLHLDISPDNIMLVGSGKNERIFLIDFNSTYAIGSNDHAYLSCKPGYSAPEVETGDMGSIGFPSDLYSVTAVFYRCLMGRTLTLEETLRVKAPDGKDSLCLKDLPETVVSLVGRILKKGLHTLPAKRYQSIGQMRQAFAELIDRIDCVGVTHWSLWENGKRSVEELIRINPSLRYLKEANNLYPIRLKTETSLTLSRYLEDTLSPEGRSSLIVAQGGMGKTTLLLHTAMLHSKRYSPNTPAVFYISLNSWNGKDAHYIQNQILMSLRFKRDMNNYDSASHALRQLLNQPLKTRVGEVPTVLLLLDGLNEIHGDPAALVQEINELSKLAGVRIIATSRNEMPALQLQTAELIPLEVEDIESALGRNGLLIPQKQEALQLLRTPLILSIYIQASEAGKQLEIKTEEDLMKAYMDALLQKELKQLPEEASEKWQIDVALNYVLPAIAAEVKKKGHALTERQMLKIVEECRKTLRSLLLKRAFPQWIGHSKDIFHEAKTAEQWYGIVIHTILCQRLGLLIRDDEGRYRVFHQSVGDHLAKNCKDTVKGVRRRRRFAGAVCVLILIYCLGGALDMLLYHVIGLQMQEYTAVKTVFDAYSRLLTDSIMLPVNAAEAYLEEPTQDNLRKARMNCSEALQRLKEKYFDDVEFRGYTDYSEMDEWLLQQSGLSTDILWRLQRGHLTDSDYVYNTVIDDYAIFVCILDAILAESANNPAMLESLELCLTYLKDVSRLRQDMANMARNSALLIVGIGDSGEHWSDGFVQPYVWCDDPEVLLEEIVEKHEEVSRICEEFLTFRYSLPADIRNTAENNFDIYICGQRWTHIFGQHIIRPKLPPGWTPPDWLPEDMTSDYITFDPVANEFVSGTAIIPVCWYTTCYGISREEVIAYVEAEDPNYRILWEESLHQMQVVADFSGMTVTILWTPNMTYLIVSGFDIDF